MKESYRIALVGNPNCGKTCIFNALTGARQHVGNYPGVTVESKSGNFVIDGIHIELIDLPGVYSLSSSSPEEGVVFQELMQPGIDLVINVVDSTIPQRSLYLSTQIAELHLPMLFAFNMADEARQKGVKFDIPKLEKFFGSPIVQTIGCRADGVTALIKRLKDVLANLDKHGIPEMRYDVNVEEAISGVSAKLETLQLKEYSHIPMRFFAIKLLEHDSSVMKIDALKPAYEEVERQIQNLRDKDVIKTDTFMADSRYAMLAEACKDTVTISHEKRREISNKIDAVMTNKFLGLPLFFLIIYLTFYFTFKCADPFIGYIVTLFDWLTMGVEAIWPAGFAPFLHDLIVEGIIGGVGGVLVFLPYILFLFFAIAILEESGYMARAAFVMDGVMRKFGLQGRSFVPLVLGFGCSVPAIMATRTIESDFDRKTTIMVLPLMSCDARLPIYTIICSAFFTGSMRAPMMMTIYVIGIVVALIAAFIMKNTLFKGNGEIFLMELPPYRMPILKSLLIQMWDRSKMYVHKAGTIILAATIILFLANKLPEKKVLDKDYDQQIEALDKQYALTDAQIKVLEDSKLWNAKTMTQIKDGRAVSEEMMEGIDDAKMNEALKKIVEFSQEGQTKKIDVENEKLQELMEYTISGRVGKFMEPLFRHIGFDWKMSTATIGALAAKEVFVAQLGVLYAAGQADEENQHLIDELRKNYTPLQGFCMMLFNLLSIPCLATVAIMKRELNSWKLTGATVAGLLIIAFVLSMIAFKVGTMLEIGTKLVAGM